MASGPLNSLQAGRAFAALAVLAYHANMTLALPKYLGRDLAPAFSAGDSGVDFFFVLSGFVIFLAHRGDIGNPAKVGPFFWKRFKRIYPPLWAVLLILLPVFFLIPATCQELIKAPMVILWAFLISPVAKEYLLGAEWTLRHEILFYLVFGLILWRPRAGLALVGAWILLSLAQLASGWSYPWSFCFAAYHFLFLFGVIVALVFVRRVEFLPRLLLAVGAAMFLLCWTAVCLKLLPKNDTAILINGFGAALAVYGAATLERNGALATPRALIFLGEASYSIYLVHYPVVSMMSKLFTRLNENIQLPDLLVISATLGVPLAAGVIFHVAVEKPLLGSFARVRKMEAVSSAG
jgi:exopolysaccharide production protein ExoZ